MEHKEQMERYKNFIRLRKEGATFGGIAEMYGITRQAVQSRVKKGLPKKPTFEVNPLLAKYNLSHLEGRDRIRALVRIRDNFTCQGCGEKRLPKNIGKDSLFERNLDVHHLGGMCGKNSRGYDAIKDIGKLITLCHKCHFNHAEHSQRINKKL